MATNTKTAEKSQNKEDEEENESLLVATASSWCASNGVLMGARDPESHLPLSHPQAFEPAPFSLHPTPFPRAAFSKAYDLSKPFNGVVHECASTYGVAGGWLRNAVETAAKGDAEFTGKLVELADEVIRDGGEKAQNAVLGILRSDYMLHSPPNNDKEEDDAPSRFANAVPLQVELNTIASSFGCLSTKVTKLHQHLNRITEEENQSAEDLPDNGAADGIANGIAMALEEYDRQRKEAIGNESGVVLAKPVAVMVVQPGETNSVDQRDLEFILQQKYNVRMIRRTLHEIGTMGAYGKNEKVFNGKELLLPEGKGSMVAAAVVYYRAGYRPDDYPTDVEWEARKLVEHSGAIKCPDIFYHIFGTKKVQQALAEPGALRPFCTSDEEQTFISSSFAGLYALGEGDDSEAVSAALANPHGYVLKPQREGGGNNLYDDELVNALKTMSYEERGAFILMQKILPPSSLGKLVRTGRIIYDGECVCELGVFGISLRRYGKDGGILLNEVVGHILRSKSTQTDEGGVAAGYAFLSSPRLC